jgi:starch phosphorylase
MGTTESRSADYRICLPLYRIQGHRRFQDLFASGKSCWNRWRLVQIAFAGKAHPADEHGTSDSSFIPLFDPEFAVMSRSRKPRDARRNSDSGCGCLAQQLRARWRPRTSGQKAGMNGIPNLSILDGCGEGYNARNG